MEGTTYKNYPIERGTDRKTCKKDTYPRQGNALHIHTADPIVFNSLEGLRGPNKG